jgi:hypothetical protein
MGFQNRTHHRYIYIQLLNSHYNRNALCARKDISFAIKFQSQLEFNRNNRLVKTF